MGKRGPKIDEIPLPEWFDLGKYARAGELTLAEWYEQLYIRFMLYRRFTGATRISGVAAVRAAGIVKPKAVPFYAQALEYEKALRDGKIKAWNRGIQRAGNPGDSHGVRRMTGDDLYCVSNGLDIADVGDAWRMDPIERHSGGLENEAVLVIDLSVSDTVLVDQFKEMLQAIRQEGGDLERRQVEPQQWAKYAVLPCLDLTEWARETGVRLGMKQLARTVFYDDLEGARWREIKRFTLPAMQRVMNPAFLKTLKSRIPKG